MLLLFLKKHFNILVAIGTNLLLVLFAIFVFGARYAVDDDIAMARIAYGVFFEPQTRLVFACTIFGAILKGLSSLLDGINWQVVLYYLFLLYGGIVSFYYVLKRNKRLLTITWILVVGSFYYSSYVNINFSLVTSMLAFFGYITLFIGAYIGEKRPVVLSSVTLIFAMIIRYESFFAVSLFAVFAFVLVFAREGKKEGVKNAMFKFVVPFAIALSIPVCLVVVDRLSYSNEAWSSYLEYNDSRSQILDFQSVLQHENQDYFRDLGLSEEMVKSLKKWQYNDTEIFNETLIHEMGTDSKKYNPKITMSFLFEALGYSVEKICKMYYFAFGVLLLGVLTISKEDKRNGLVKIFANPWVLMLPLVAELGFYFFMNRGIDRVFRTTGLGFWLGILSLLCCDYFYFDKENQVINKRYVLVVATLLSILGVCLQIEDLSKIRGFKLVDKNSVDYEYAFLNDGRIYMCDIESVRVIQDSYGMWMTPSRNSLYWCVELGGWMVNYPPALVKQEKLGVSNPYKSLLNENVFLLTTEDGELQLDFLRSAYNHNVEDELVEQHGKLFVYKYGVK